MDVDAGAARLLDLAILGEGGGHDVVVVLRPRQPLMVCRSRGRVDALAILYRDKT